jgi:hypothetical protein
MADKTKDKSAKRGVRWGRILFTFLFLGAAGAGLYVASWFNARRYFMIVGATEVSVAKGRMLPVGHEPFVPGEVELRRAYEPFPLPSGISLPRGETMFSDRVELDQALFRVLKDSIAYSLSEDNRRTAELVGRYLKQIKAIPGTSVSQQLELVTLERDASYQDARQHLTEGVTALKEAARLFRESARGQGARSHDGEWRARAIEAAIDKLGAAVTSPSDAARDGASPDVRTRTATSAVTSTTAR